MDGTYTKGQHLLLETNDGTVEGKFHSMGSDHHQLTLTEVVLPTTGEELQGLCHFYAKEIKSVRLLEPGTMIGQNSENEAAKNYNLMRRVPVPINPGRQPSMLKECDLVANYNPQQHTANSWRRNHRTPLEDFKAQYEMTQRYIYVENIELLEKVMMVISKEQVVAVEVMGVDIGWAAQIGLLNVATQTRTILFDIQKLGSKVFDLCLRELLQSKDVLKVVHNCQMLSDFLLREHNVQLCNVFDTQVACLIKVLNRYGDLPMVMRSVRECFSLHLGLPECLSYQLEVRDGYIRTDLLPWIHRPLHLLRRQAAVKNAVFLLSLWEKLQDIDQESLAFGTGLFMGSVQNPLLHSAKFFLVPPEMQEVVNKLRQQAFEQVHISKTDTL